MKHLMLGTAMAMILGASASAQDMFRSEVDAVAITASDFIGKRVYAVETPVDADEYAGVQADWSDIGEINDIILTRDGRVDAVLLDIGGFLGMGERQVALGMENIRFVADAATPDNLDDFFLVVNVNRGVLEGAPAYMGMNDAMVHTGTDAAKADGTAPADTAATDTATSTPMMVDGFTAVDPATITTETLVGMRVYGPNGEDLGEISEVVAADAGMAAQVIVDVGGFLGMGEKPVALDVTSMQFMRETEGEVVRAYVTLTQDQLESLPAYSM